MLSANNTKLIIDALNETNPWWKKEFNLDYKPRTIHNEITKYINEKQIIALTGLRRVGKTTLMKKMVLDFLKTKPKEEILFFSFDNFKNTTIKEILNIYFQIFGEKENIILFLDEIQKLNNWEEQIKRIYDNYPNYKIFISGSESLFIKNKSRESLAGRFYEFTIQPLSFKEYLNFINFKLVNHDLQKNEILFNFNNYLKTNGFPEIINKNDEIINKYLKENIIERIIYKDIPEMFKIKEPSILYSLYNIISSKPGSIIDFSEIASDLKISRQTVSLYISYLENTFLIKKLYNYSNNERKTEKKLKKFYPIITFTNDKGLLFENYVVNELNPNFFWRDERKNEIDLVLTNPLKAIEIKFSKSKSKSLKLFMSKFKCEGKIITYDLEEDLAIPFYKEFI